MSVDSLIDKLSGDPGYIRFLLVERGRIRSALLARSPLPDDESRAEAFSSSIGNTLHNDLIELDVWLASLAPGDRELLADWAFRKGERQIFASKTMTRQSKGRRVVELVRAFGARNA